MNDFDMLKTALAEIAEVPLSLLDKLTNKDNGKALLYDSLFPILGWDDDYQSFEKGQFMEYMEWKEPYLNFDKFFIIKQRHLSINTNDMFEDYDEVVGDEDEMEMMDVIESYDLHRQYCFNYFNKKLAPHKLRLVELGNHENAYFLLIHDDKLKLENLIQACNKFGIDVILE